MRRRRWSYVMRYLNGRRFEIRDLPYKLEVGRRFDSVTLAGRRHVSIVVSRSEA